MSLIDVARDLGPLGLPIGRGASGSATGGDQVDFGPMAWPTLPAFSAILWFVSPSNAAGSDFASLIGNVAAFPSALTVQLKTTGAVRYFYRDGSSNLVQIDTPTGQDNGVPHWLFIVKRAANDHQLYVDGASAGTSSVTIGSTADANTGLFAIGTNTLPVGGAIGRIVIVARALSLGEARAIAFGHLTPDRVPLCKLWAEPGTPGIEFDFSGNRQHATTIGANSHIVSVSWPYRTLRQPIRYVPPPSNPITVTPSVGQLTLTGFAPTVAVSNNIVVAPGVGALLLAGFAPTMAVSDNRRAQPGAGALTLTGFAPTVVLSGNQVAAPGVGALTVTGLAPAILTPRVVTPGVGQLTVTGLAPTVLAGVSVSPGVGQLTLTGLAPTVATTANEVVTPGIGSLTLAGLAPTILTPAAVSPGVGALALAGFAPTVTTNGAALGPSPLHIIARTQNTTVLARQRNTTVRSRES